MFLKPPRTAPAPPRPSRVPPTYPGDTAPPGSTPGEAFDDTAPIPVVPLPVASLRPPPGRRTGVAPLPLRVRLAGAAVLAVIVAASLLWAVLTATPTQHSLYAQAAPPGAGPGTTLPGPSATRGHLRSPASPGEQDPGQPSQPQGPSQGPSRSQRIAVTDVHPTVPVPSTGQGPPPSRSTAPTPPGSTAPTPPPISQSPPPPHSSSPSPSPTQSGGGGCVSVLGIKVCL